ncbi:hypothetical protein EMIT0324P_20712 [Pseudomonas chlororaphis]
MTRPHPLCEAAELLLGCPYGGLLMPAEVRDRLRFVHMDDLHSRISSCSLDSLEFVNHYRQRLVANIQYRPEQLLIQRRLLADFCLSQSSTLARF